MNVGKNKMKMTSKQYATLQTALFATLTKFNIDPARVNSERNRWDMFHAACNNGHVEIPDLWNTLTDAHIDTAMRHMFKPYLKEETA